MPPVVAAVAAVIGVVTATVGAVAGVVGTVLGFVVAPVAAVIGSVLAPITAALTAILGPIIAPIASVIGTVLEPINLAVGVVTKELIGPLKEIMGLMDAGIKDIGESILLATAPVMDPLTGALTHIKDYGERIQDSIIDDLDPARQTANTLRSIGDVKMMAQMLTSTGTVTDKIELMAQKYDIETAGSIATLWEETIRLNTGVMTNLDDHYSIVTGEIDRVEGNLTESQERELAAVNNRIDTSTNTLREETQIETDLLYGEISAIDRKMSALPWFREMMIQGLV